MASLDFSCLPEQPHHEQQRIIDLSQADDYPDKILLTYGAYRDYEGRPWVLPIVQSTAKEIISSSDINLEYIGPYGTDRFRNSMTSLMGDKARQLADKKKLGVIQTVGGTCALRICLELLRDLGATSIYVSSPTWSMHLGISKSLGYKIKTYRYWDTEKLCLDWDGLISDVRQAEEGSIILLQLCAHNPTGIDLTTDKWRQLISCIKEKGLFPVLDCAYLGLASGSLDEDRVPMTMFLEENIQALFAFTMSKSFGLYSERLGAIAYTVDDQATYGKVWQSICNLIMVAYMSNNGVFAEVTSRILSDPKKKAIWERHLTEMVKRLEYARRLFYYNLSEYKVAGNWEHILRQRGMYAYTGLTKPQCEFLRRNHIHLYDDGRMNVGDITDKNVKRLVSVMKEAADIK